MHEKYKKLETKNTKMYQGKEYEIVTNKNILSIKSTPCHFDTLNVNKNKQIGALLLNTGMAFQDECYGLASNQVNEFKRIIMLRNPYSPSLAFVIMCNPIIYCKKGGMKSMYEGCLSRPGEKRIKIRRYKGIKVQWWTVTGETKQKEFNGIMSRAIQHEIDHLNGLLL